MWTNKESELEALKRRLDKAKNERHTATMPYILKIEINEEKEKQELLWHACRAIWSEETLKKKIAEVQARAAKYQKRQDAQIVPARITNWVGEESLKHPLIHLIQNLWKMRAARTDEPGVTT